MSSTENLHSLLADDSDELDSKQGKTKNEKIDNAEARIELNKYDTEAWTILLSEVQEMDIVEARAYYERFFEIFPTAARYWKIYAEHEMKNQNRTQVAQIFQRCLETCPNIELWKYYIDYVKQYFPAQDVINAYKLSIYNHNIGLDISSSSLWIDYLKLLKDLKITDQQQRQQQIMILRNCYQEAIQIPMHDIDKIWKDYEIFENEVNPSTAKTILQEFSPKYKSALTKYKEKKNVRENLGTGGLLLNMLATPPINNEKERVQKQIWRELVELEKKNNQRLPQQEVKRRVMFAYKQCLLCFYHHPDIWYEAAMYLVFLNLHEEAEEIFKKGCNVLLPPLKKEIKKENSNVTNATTTTSYEGSTLLHFAYAEYMESRKKFDETEKIYESLCSLREDPLVYVQYLRFIRRTKGMDAAREVFIRFRKNPNCSYHVWIASALIEHSMNDQPKVATKVFELGLKPFGKEPGFILEYLKFLEHLNDKNNMRVLFERILNDLPKEKSIEIWNKFLQFEYSLGDINSIEKVEERRSQIFPESINDTFSTSPSTNNATANTTFGVSIVDTPQIPTTLATSSATTTSFNNLPKGAPTASNLVNLINRMKFLDLWPCTPKEMEILNLKPTESDKLPTDDDNHRKYAKSFYHVDYSKQITFTNTRQQEKSTATATTSVQNSTSIISSSTTPLPSSFSKLRNCFSQKRLFLPDFKQMHELKITPNPVVNTNGIPVVEEHLIPNNCLNVLKRIPIHSILNFPNFDYVMDMVSNVPLPPPPNDDKRNREDFEAISESALEEQEEEEDTTTSAIASKSFVDIYSKRRKQKK
ncbi:hypothetical protein ABK040_005389 [Willaertia magna]